jgi:cell division protein FtsL
MTTQATPVAVRRARERADVAVQAGSPRIVPLMFFSLLVIAIFFSMIYLRIAMDRSAFELDAINEQITLEQSRTLDLRLELAQLQDPQKIAAQAAQIGLIYPDEQITLVVTGDRSTAAFVQEASSADALEDSSP